MSKFPLGLLVCLALLPLGPGCQKTERQAEFPAGRDSPFGSTTAVSTRRAPDRLEIQGTFVAARRVRIKSEFSGRLENLAVAKGQAVSSQNPLFRIEDEQLSQELTSLRGQLRIAESQLEQRASSSEPEEVAEELPEETVVETPIRAEVEELPAYAEPTFSRLASEVEFTSVDAGGVWPAVDPRVIARSNDSQDAGGIWPSYGIREKVTGEGFYSTWTAFFAAADQPMPSRVEEFTAAQNFILTQPVKIASQPEAPPILESSEIESGLALFRARVELMRAELAILEDEWTRREISPPFDGRIQELPVSEGGNVEAGDLLVEIYQVDPIEFSFSVPKDQVDFLALGMTVQGKVSASPDLTFEGQISYIGAELNSDGETVEVRARVGNSDEAYKVGAKGSAEIDLKSEFTAQIR